MRFQLLLPSIALFGTCDAQHIPVPTAAQARYQDTDFIALIHFNMGTFAHNGDPCCDPSNWDGEFYDFVPTYS
jgi:hypothetical protein